MVNYFLENDLTLNYLRITPSPPASPLYCTPIRGFCQ